MNVRSIGGHVTAAVVLLASTTLVSHAQVRSRARTNSVKGRAHTNSARGSANTNSASHVAAEMTKGKLSPRESKPGDKVAIKLQDDVRSNGEVILKKGAILTGVVRNVTQAGRNSESKGLAQAMMEIEWVVPSVQGRAVQSVSFALQSVTQVNATYHHEQDNAFDEFGVADNSADSSVVSRPIQTSGGPSNTALLSMPSVVAVDQQTSSSIERTLGASPSERLFKVGQGQLVSAGGSKQSVELYSHLSNDTVITSPDKNFEISSGAHMQMLVGVNRR